MASMNWKRAALLGFLSWLIPFLIGFAAFPIKKVNAPLFDTLMSIAMVATAALLGRRYFADHTPPASEAITLGFFWLAINLVCDYPMFSAGPMKMTVARYYCEIGAGYLLYPAFLAGTAWVRRTA